MTRIGNNQQVKEAVLQLKNQGATVETKHEMIKVYLTPETHDVPKVVKILECLRLRPNTWSCIYNMEYLKDMDAI